MQYSCAYFTSDDDTLEDAQQNKLRLIASKLNLKPARAFSISAAAGATWRFISRAWRT